MGKGSYHGGGTLIGWGRSWSDSRDFPKPEHEPKIGHALSKRDKRRSRRLALISDLTHKEILAELGIGKLPFNLSKRSLILKQLVADGILLDTGRPNPQHPKIQSLVDRKMTKRWHDKSGLSRD